MTIIDYTFDDVLPNCRKSSGTSREMCHGVPAHSAQMCHGVPSHLTRMCHRRGTPAGEMCLRVPWSAK